MRIFGFEISRARPHEQAKQAIDTAKKGYSGNGLMIPQYYGGGQSKLITALGGSSSTLEILGDPRSKIITFQAMVAAFPEVARTLRIHELIMGCPEIESDDQVFADEANAMLREWVWREALTFEGNTKKGLDSFIGNLAKRTMVEGQQFYEVLDSAGMPVLTSRQKIAATKLHNSLNFAYYEYQPQVYRLQYTDGVTQELDKKITAAFQSVAFDHSPSYPWGVGLLYNAATMALKAAIMEENQIKIYQGKGSAPRVTLFGLEPREPKDANIVSSEDLAAMDREAQELVTEVTAQYMEGLANANKYGNPKDITAGVVGKLSMETHSIADKIEAVSTYSEDIKLALSRLVVAMNGEPALVGLPSAGDGQGGNRTEIQSQSMASYGKSLRAYLQPHVNQLFLSQAARLSMRLPKYKWEWEGLDVTDVKALAEIEKQKADTLKVQVDTIVALTQAGEISAAANLAKKHGWDWFEGSEVILE